MPTVSSRAGGAIVGRDADAAEVAALLTTDRLVTLVGPPGVGKSRLAAEVSAPWADQALRVDLADIGRAEHVREALSMDSAPALLVVDNADRWVGLTTEVVAGHLQRHPALVALITSRERLGLAEEAVHHV